MAKKKRAAEATSVEEIRALIAVYTAAMHQALTGEFEELTGGKPIPKKWLTLAGIGRKRSGAPGYLARGLQCAQHSLEHEAGRDSRTVEDFCRSSKLDERQYYRYVKKYGPIIRRRRLLQFLEALKRHGSGKE